jgi:hypothetical protein
MTRPARLLVSLMTLVLVASVVPDGTAEAAGPAMFAGGGGGPDYRWESTFAGPGLDDTVAAAVVWDDGSGPALYVAGLFLTAGDRRVNRIARWDGERWSALAGPSGTGTNGPVSALAVYDGELVAAGSFTSAGGVTVNHIARWDGEAWSPLAGPDGTGVEGDRGPGVFALAVLDGQLVAGGAFSHAGGTLANNVARWDGQRWAPLAGGTEPGVGHAIVPPSVYALQELDDDLVVAGRFTHAGGAPAAGVARWDGGGWSPLGGGVGGMVVPTVSALAAYDGELVAAGQFPQADGVVVNNLARWDGQAWSPLGAGTSGTVYALAVTDGELVAGGGFAEAGGTVVSNVARWDGQAWSPLAGSGGVGVRAGISTHVAALLPVDGGPVDGGLLVGGRFETAGGLVVNNLASWDGVDWSVPAGSTSGGLSGGTANVQAVIPYQGDLVVGGGFTQAGGQVVNRIARWDGATWSPLGSGFDSFQVRALAAYEGDLVAGGQFTEAGGQVVNRIARWDGEAWSPLAGPGGVGLDGEVIALAVHNGGAGGGRQLRPGGRGDGEPDRPVGR